MDKKQLLEYLNQCGFPKRIIDAFGKVKRENFVPATLKNLAYENTSLPIGFGQTISQPHTIAVMLDMLNLKESQKVLEIGSGCGYVLSLISEIVGSKGKVYGVEIVSKLVENSISNLKQYENIKVYNSDGKKGLKKYAPFDRILISAALKKVPENILKQLKDKGILVAPVGPSISQTLIAVQKEGEDYKIKSFKSGFVFVPFV